MFLRIWGRVQLGVNGFAHDPVRYARAVKSPALVLHGGQDTRVTEEQAQTLFASLPEPKEYLRNPQAGHESIVLVSPMLWRRHVTKFLTRVIA